jgi:hypothetical protein
MDNYGELIMDNFSTVSTTLKQHTCRTCESLNCNHPHGKTAPENCSEMVLVV